MKIKIELIDRPNTPDAFANRLMLRLPDGDEYFATDSIYSLLFHLGIFGMNFDNGFTIETDDITDHCRRVPETTG